ncbi:retrovirus-related pol polyprotein from transposon TNT 1-94 [Tanacetum coccineum]|uniref:Retrovirus-related pol polyprotein from transposon TNT 1-94 n=1 Tax=Tanacetum coccineum TaxID=301880 RepID=A0ABQ4YIP8_9ASTR
MLANRRSEYQLTKMKNYVAQLKCLGYVLSRDLSVGLIMNGLTSDFAGFVRNYNKHNMGKTIGELHALLIDSLHLQTCQSERRNHTLLDIVRSMMNLTTLSLSFWDYALESVARILNMVPTKKRDTPDKLQQRSFKCIFVGYLKETMGYYFYFPPENKLVVVRYVEFLEKNLISQEVSGRDVELGEIQNEDTPPSENTSKISMEVEELNEHSLRDLNEPTNYKAVMLDPESNKWLDVMNAEMQSIKDNQVWHLVDLPPNCKTVGRKWIFKKKIDMDGIKRSHPVSDIRAIRILIARAAFYDYEMWQMDVKTTFLNGYLDEDIYMV